MGNSTQPPFEFFFLLLFALHLRKFFSVFQPRADRSDDSSTERQGGFVGFSAAECKGVRKKEGI